MVHARRLVEASGRRTIHAVRQIARTTRDRANQRSRPGNGGVPLLAGDSLDAIARQVDLRVGEQILGETYRYDVRRSDLPVLLASSAALAAGNRQRAWVHVDGQLTKLDTGVPSRLVASIARSGRFRLVMGDDRNVPVANVCIEVWVAAAKDSWRAVAADAPVRRIRAQAATGPTAQPVPIDTVPQFPIDAVYTWVNAADPAWRSSAAQFRDLIAIDPDRFVQSEELRYSLRSLEFFAPWIRRVHVLTNCAPPAWFVPSDRIRWIDHRDVIPAEYLPLFNSDAIETFLHRLPDLAEHFIYLNDDFLLADSVFPRTFFTWGGRSVASMLTRNSTLFMRQLVESGEAEDWESSRVNGARLLQERFGVFPTLLHEHAPYALTRTGWAALEQAFPNEIEATRRSRFRAHEDISWTAFVYHHYGLLTGSTVPGAAGQYEISADTMKRLSRGLPEPRTFAVVADRGGSSSDAAFTTFKARYLKTHWPFPSTAERAGA